MHRSLKSSKTIFPFDKDSQYLAVAFVGGPHLSPTMRRPMNEEADDGMSLKPVAPAIGDEDPGQQSGVELSP